MIMIIYVIVTTICRVLAKHGQEITIGLMIKHELRVALIFANCGQMLFFLLLLGSIIIILIYKKTEPFRMLHIAD